MKANILRAFIITGTLASLCAGSGCVADRPSRNGVFDENQYIRKDFLIRPGSGGQDPGWFMKTTIEATSVPNPFAPSGMASIEQESSGYVNFVVTSDRLLMNNMIEPSQDQTQTGSISAQGTRNQETIDSWPVTNVDLKYQVNLDGEKTNFYQENQELDWQMRQWVKVNFDKNDQSDFVTFGDVANEFLAKCADTSDISATLHPGSFQVDEANNYWQFAVDVTVPVVFNQLPSTSVTTGGSSPGSSTSYDTYCASQFGYSGVMFQKLGRQNVTFTLMYSFMRATEDPTTSFDQLAQDQTQNPKTYMPLVIPEKDNIQRKYGVIMNMLPSIDNSTGLWGSRQLAIRHDPNGAQFTYYFAPGWPENYKWIFGNKQDDGTYSGGGGIVDQTNELLKLSGAKTKLVVMDYDAQLAPGQPPRDVGDVRYSFLRWVSDLAQDFDTGPPWLAVTQFVADPRSGQIISTSINFDDWAWQDYLLARMDYYEQTIGAFNFGPPGSCTTTQYGNQVCVPKTCQDGDTMALVPQEVAKNHNGTSTLFTKMQQYLGKPMATWGNLGPQDFVIQHDQNFYDAFYKILPYEVFADPGANPYVVWEGGSVNYGSSQMQIGAGMADSQFQSMMATIASGKAPYDVDNDLANGGQNSSDFLAQMQTLTLAHRDYEYVKQFAFPNRMADEFSMFNLPQAFGRDARHCIKGQWETRQQYVQNMIASYYALTWWHEFGHSLGLQHNFMGSIDQPNYPHYQDASKRDHIGLYTSSLMEYNLDPDRVFWSGSNTYGGVSGKPGWAPYDQAAITFIYANSSTSAGSLDSGNPKGLVGSSVSGQSGTALDPAAGGKVVTASNARWKDPLGFCPTSGTNQGKAPGGQACTPGAEIQYLYCTNSNTKYTPFCREFDMGTTPSEIIASQIDAYEWQYLWRNYPQYHQYYDFSPYANAPAGFFTDARRFLSSWAYDWAGSQLDDTFRRVGVVPPTGVPEATYYDQLDNQFNQDISMANQLYAATTQGIIQQSSGERPFVTIYDSYFGDTTQQGIAIDKSLALQAFTALWPIDNYDQNQAQGSYLSGFSFQADPGYEAVAEAACLSMVGGQYQMFPWAIPLGVQQFAEATHSVYYQQQATGGRPDMKDWIGGYVFDRRIDFENFFRNLAVNYNTVDSQGKLLCPTDQVETCTYDPTIKGTADDPEAAFHSDPFNQFIGPDNRRWIWVYLQDANRWIAADRDRNVATWVMMYGYNSDVLYGEDDGTGGFSAELPLKYFLNYYQTNGN